MFPIEIYENILHNLSPIDVKDLALSSPYLAHIIKHMQRKTYFEKWHVNDDNTFIYTSIVNKSSVKRALYRQWYMRLKFNDYTCPILLQNIRYVKNQLLIIDLSQTNIQDVSALGNVHTLYLSHTKVSNVSTLGKLHTLYLSSMNVIDLSALHTLSRLYLSWCHNVRDVSMLGKLHTLHLLCCGNVSDVSALGNVHTLDLSWTKVTDISALDKVVNFTLPNGKKRKL